MGSRNSHKNFSKTTHFLIGLLVALIINFLGFFLCKWLNLPILGDSIGTVFMAVSFGPAAGMVVGGLTAFVTWALGFAPSLSTVSGIIVGLIAGLFLSRKSNYDYFGVVTVAILSAFISALIGMIIDMAYFDLLIENDWGAALQGMLSNYVINEYVVLAMAELFIYIPDRVIAFIIAFIVIHIFKKICLNNDDKRRRKAETAAVILVFALTLSIGNVSTAANTVGTDATGIDESDTAGYTDFEIKKYGHDAGLPSSQINAVLQSRDGYIWIGSYSGLYRYDGIKIEIANIDDRIRNVMSLYEDTKGQMWIGTNDSGAFCYNPENGDCIRYSKADGLDSGSIRAICEDRNGNIYLGSMVSLARVSSNGDLKVFDNEDIEYSRYLSSMNDGNVVGVTSGGLLYVMRDDKIIDSVRSSDEETPFKEVECHENEIIVGSKSDIAYVYIFEDDKLKLKDTFSLAPLENVNDLLYCPQYQGYFVCCRNGLGYFDEKEKRPAAIEKDSFKGEINAATVDSQGNIWFASSKDGIIKYSKTPFENLIRKAGMTGSVTNAILVDGNEIYIGTDYGLQIINKSTNQEIKKEGLEILDGVRIRNILKDSQENIWFSTFGSDELVKLSKDGNIRIFDDKIDGLNGKNMRLAIELSDGRILVSGADGLTFIKDDKVDAKLTYEDGLEITSILTLVEREDGTIMAGSDGDGIYLIKNDKVVGHIGEAEGLETEVVLRIVKCSSGYFYVTSNAIYYDDGEKIKLLDDFYSNNYDIIIKDGRCWIPSSAGLYVGDEKDLRENNSTEFTLMDESWGLTSSLNSNSWNYLDGDDLYLCCLDGVRRFSVNVSDDIYSDYQVHLKDISTANGTINKKNGRFIIPAVEGRIDFNIAVNNFTLSNPYIFYYLEGRENEGVISKQDEIVPLTYSHLYGGDYTLCIQVYDSTTFEPLIVRKIKITKEKMMYEKLYFQLYLILVIGFVVFYFGWLFYVINKRTRRIRGLQKEMTTDPMTGILNKAGSHRALEAACREETGMLLMIDLDSFKLVNDLYGHDMGDKILIRFAELLQSAVGEEDICGRLGGDEFVAFIKNTIDKDDVEKITTFMNREIVKSAKEYMGDDMQIPLGTSIGAVRVPEEGREFEEVFKLADKALYVVKQNGKHGYYIYQKKAEKKDNIDGNADSHDLKNIKKIISERNEGRGAYEVNFDKLQTLYKFINRDDRVKDRKTDFVRISIQSNSSDTAKIQIPDEVIEAFEDTLVRALSKNDIVSAYSGDFFVLFMEDSPEEKLQKIITAWKQDEKYASYTVDYEIEAVGE